MEIETAKKLPVGTKVIWFRSVHGSALRCEKVPAELVKQGDSKHRIKIKVVENGKPFLKSAYPENVELI